MIQFRYGRMVTTVASATSASVASISSQWKTRFGSSHRLFQTTRRGLLLGCTLPSVVFALIATTATAFCPRHRFLSTGTYASNRRNYYYHGRNVHYMKRSMSVTGINNDSGLGEQNNENDARESNRSLVDAMKDAYLNEATDGIMKLATSKEYSNYSVDEYVAAALGAVENNGDVASIMNALVGSCCMMMTTADVDVAADRLRLLMEAFDELDEAKKISPDIVTYSLAYKAFSTSEEYSDLAVYSLECAQRRSKKLSGGRRRKALAAIKRKAAQTCMDSLDELKRMCGDDFEVLDETTEYVAIVKPTGVPCFHKRATTAGRRGTTGKTKDKIGMGDISLEDALLLCNVPLSTLNPEAFGLVHRLDRGTSGCMVLAKTDHMHANLVAEFFLRQTEKKYLTLVSPAPSDSCPIEGVISSPVGDKPAMSSYRITDRFGDEAALVEFNIHTGRKHQVRVHASEGLHAPILGDTKYYLPTEFTENNCGNSSNQKQQRQHIQKNPAVQKLVDKHGHFYLHSSRLSIPNHDIEVEASLPSWWQTTISAFGSQEKTKS